MNHSQSSVLEGADVANAGTDFRTRLRHFGVTYQQVADRVVVSDAYISMIAIGRRPLTERIRVAADNLCREAASRKVAEAATLIGTLIGEQAGSDVDQELLALREKLLGLKAEAELLLTDKSGKAA